MKDVVTSYLEKFKRERKEYLRWIGIIAALALVVVLGVFWRLHYTGIALTNEVYCGLEEHTHDESCYADVLICGLEEAEPVEGHAHSDACYETVTTLICGQEETPGHIHTDACYETIPAQLICGQDEDPGHYHDAGCYDEEGNLICGQEEYEGHTHTEACWSYEERILICGQEEYEGHTHTDACYQIDTVLVCGLEECEPVEGHTHTEACYEKQLVCDLEEHTHTIECMTDENADLETAGDWEATLPNDLTGIWAEDVVKIAQSQVGYEESTRNFILDEDGETRKGYSRYGAWYGNEYGSWDAMFASFCLYYAGVPEDLFPEASGSYAWSIALADAGAYRDVNDATPRAGDLIFLDKNGDGLAECVGIVTIVGEDGSLTVIEGDFEDAVRESAYGCSDGQIKGYGHLPDQPGLEAETETEPETETETESETETEAETEIETETESETETEVETETETETETEVETESESETESETEEEISTYRITYSSDEPEAFEIDGPDSAEEGEDLYFYVTVADGYELTEVMANEEEIEPEEISVSDDEEEYTYTFLLTDISEDTIVLLDARQVLKGSGSVDVYEYVENENTVSTNAVYTLTVTDVPTNTKISLSSPNLTLKDANQAVIELELEGNLYYVAEGDSFEKGAPVAYLMLDDDDTDSEDTFVLTPYASNDQPFVMAAGKLVVNIPGELDDIGTVKIYQIQTNKLCYLDGNNKYQQELIEAVATFDPEIFIISGYAEGTEIDLETLTEKASNEFYYGSVDSFELTPCTKGKIVDGQLLPLDGSGNPVSGVSIYMVYDRVYSFDVKITDVVNEHTEDNGDTYLWLGDTFYIDQYHEQGVDGYVNNNDKSSGYTRSQNTLANCGVWVQLGRIREGTINEGTKSFSDYKNVSYESMLAEGVSLSGFDSANAADTAKDNAPYGIAGPYKFENEESAPATTTKRITGHVGDEFTASEAFGSDIVYMVTDQKLQTDWFNVGCHASDNGFRAWFYWINDYYKLNNYEDEVEFLEIYEDEISGEVRLEADELGSDGKGEMDDIWEITGLFTKRNSVIKGYMLETNMDALIEDGVGFYEYAGWMEHIQLRLNTTVESVINGVVYNGVFTILYSNDAPKVEFNIAAEAVSDPTDKTLNGSTVLKSSNAQETSSYSFGYYINPLYGFDPNKVQITVTIYATGTLTADRGDPIVYNENNPLIYTTTLTSEQLQEAADECPNNAGYDVAINLSDAVKVDNETEIMLYKVWDDDENSLHSRDDVTAVTVSLERSTDGQNWETVLDDTGMTKAFTIRGDSSSYVWNLTLNGADLDLTDTDGTPYAFRIAEEQEINRVADGCSYTYTIGEYEDGMSLVVMNSLNYQTEITGIKQWFDENGEPLEEGDSRIPDSVTIAVLQDGQFYDMQTVTKDNDWKFTFDKLPQSINGGEEVYTYTLCELDEDGKQLSEGDFILLDDLLFRVGEVTSDDDPDNDYVMSNYAYATEELPYTGGSGTIPFTLAGLLLISGSAYLLNKKRNLSNDH